MGQQAGSRAIARERVGLLVGALSLAAALAWAPAAQAQQTGEIRGRVTSAASSEGLGTVVVVATGEAAQGEQFGLSESDGSFVIPLLPPGTYTIRFELGGFRTRTVDDVVVELGQTRQVEIELVPTAIEAQRIVVTAPRTPSLDSGSFESGTNLTREFIQSTPSGRTYTQVLRQTPGATTDRQGVSVFGGTGVENTYVIDGMNTTGVGFGDAAADLNTDFFDEIEIKTAGYMPEFGRSTGGIFNLVLRSGGNDFHGDVFVNATPGFLRATPEAIARAGEAIGREDDPTLNLDMGFAIGGPIIRDRLWFFAGFNPQLEFTDVSRIYSRRIDLNGDDMPDVDANGRTILREVGRDHLDRTRTTWRTAGKLTLGLSRTQRLSLSYFGNPYFTSGVIRAIDASRSSNGVSGAPTYYEGERQSGSHNVALSYTGQFLDRRLRLEIFAGVHTQTDDENNTSDLPSEGQLYERALSDFETTGMAGRCTETDSTSFVDCRVRDYRQGGTGGWQTEQLTRYAAGVRLTHVLRHHTIRYGIETEYKVYDSTRGMSGGYFGSNYDAGYWDASDPMSDPANAQNHEREYYAREDPGGTYLFGTDGHPAFSATVGTLTLSAYAQDQWEINRYLTVGGGVRWDLERIGDVDGNAAITIPDEISPRLGVSFDPTGRGRSRLYASYGWYYESVPLDINQRSFSQEGLTFRYVDAAGQPICFDADGNPVPPGTPDCTLEPYGVLGGTNSPVVESLQGQYHEEWVLGAEYDLGRRWVIGASGIARRLMRAVEDISPDDGNNYFIANPGVNDCDVAPQFREPLMEACAGPTGAYDPNHTVFPEPQRLYYGLVLTVKKRLSDHIAMLASYTLSRTVGNYTGLFAADNEQLDPNISSQYDLPSLLSNRYGLLPNDHTHQFKLAGSYELGGLTTALRGLTVGVGYNGQSGAPINYLGRHPSYGRREVFILPRGSAGRTPFTHQIDLAVSYDLRLAQTMKLNFNVTVFNLFNFQDPLLVDEEYTTDTIEPAAPGTQLSRLTNAAGNAVRVNPSFGQPRLRQAPLSVRIGVRLTF